MLTLSFTCAQPDLQSAKVSLPLCSDLVVQDIQATLAANEKVQGQLEAPPALLPDMYPRRSGRPNAVYLACFIVFIVRFSLHPFAAKSQPAVTVTLERLAAAAPRSACHRSSNSAEICLLFDSVPMTPKYRDS